jgi:monodehydroascorbate reductase (NADH)
MEHVAHARASAAHAAKAVLDPSSAEAYDYLPYFYSRVFEHAGSERKVAWVFYGAQPEGAEVVVVGELRPKLFAAWIDPSGAFYISQTGSHTTASAW